MKTALLVLAGCSLGYLVLIALALRLRYVVTDTHLEVRLFGLPVRRLRLTNIDRVSKRQSRRAERWVNTLRPSHRILVIRRRTGWLREFIITPTNRYVFRTELERAIATLRAAESTESSAVSALAWRERRPN